MAAELKKQIKTYSNEFLLEQFHRRKEEYSPEALEIMASEIAARGISNEEQAAYTAVNGPQEEEVQTRVLSRDEFEPFEHLFSPVDLLLVRSMFMDAGIPFFVDNPPSELVLPLENQTSQFIRLHVHRDMRERARELIEEHFVAGDGAYSLRYTDPRQRLRAFTFNEISLSESELYESVEVSLSGEEAAAVTRYARRLIDEVEKVEAQRIVFFYDNLEELVTALQSGRASSLSRALLLTILEVLQIYCEEPDFPTGLDGMIGVLLDVFAPPRP